jgi:DNA helicase-2/ATP-dependent DNA helicase PcrA
MVTLGDDIAFLRTIKTPKRRIGNKTITRLKELAELNGQTLYQTLKENLNSKLLAATGASAYVEAIETARQTLGKKSLGDFFQTLLDKSGYEAYLRQIGDQDRLDNATELKRAVIAFGEDEEANLDDFLDNAALFSNIDKDSPKDTVKFLTIHSAKGLEFGAVFFCGLSEGVIPSHRTLTTEDLEEERRLCYVAMTRAKDKLFLSDAAGLGNNGLYKQASRFVFEAGRQNVDFLVDPDEASETRPEPLQGPPQESLFSAEQKVQHTVFGLGTILEVNFAQNCYLIKFDKLATPRSIRFASQLQKV